MHRLKHKMAINGTPKAVQNVKFKIICTKGEERFYAEGQ